MFKQRILGFGLFLALAFPLVAQAAGEARLFFVGPSSIYAQAGLKSGDVVQRIDGKPVNSVGELSEKLYKLVGSGHPHQMQIIREGKVRKLKF